MRRIIQTRTLVLVLSIGIYTFVFGFGAGALLNIYLLYTQNPLVLQYRSSLSFKSAIFGDGIVLPIINMLAASFLITNKHLINKGVVYSSLILAFLITAYFHIAQAVQGMVNWAMPSPWNWNLLGLWHGLYMFSVAFLLSFFFLVVGLKTRVGGKRFSYQALVVLIGLVVFYLLLRADLS